MKIAIISLGCPKNQVDADVYCRSLLEAGHETVAEPEAAEAILINTCGFIQRAKEEAIEAIFDAVRLKLDKMNPPYVVVTGCLAQRYGQEIIDLIPEVDAVVGVNRNGVLPQILQQLAQGGEQGLCHMGSAPFALGGRRVISTPGHYAWLKISEGCSNACSYCAIPMIRGPLRSRDFDDILAEAGWLAAQGVKELVLVAQDVTGYGAEHGGKPRIAELLTALDEVTPGVEWIRVLYAYPERITPDFIAAIKHSKKVLPYIDMPIQHIDETILASMRRKGDRMAIEQAIALVRRELPHATLRTSLIAGYPGETEEQFEALCNFVKETRFDRLGCFAYSPEEGTAAECLPGQLEQELREHRAAVIMDIQARIMAEKQEAKVGAVMDVMCDGYDEERGLWLCRSAADAPEIDANVLVREEGQLLPGGMYSVRVNQADVYDLYGQLAE